MLIFAGAKISSILRGEGMDRTKLRVIKGGLKGEAPEPSSDWTAKLRHLAKIENVLRHRHYSKLGPKLGFSIVIAVTAFICTWSVIEFFKRYGEAEISGTVGLVAAWLICVIAGMTSYRFSSLPKTYTDMLDELLTDYNPCSVSAYKALQANVVASGGIYSEPVREWLDNERYAISQAARIKPVSNRFTNRKI
jgi:hypothetical protein